MMQDSKSRKEQFLSQENVKLLEAQICEICEFYKGKYGASIVSGKYVKNALIETIRYYIRYLKEFDCRVSSLDFYKTYTWLGYFLAEQLKSQDMRYRVLCVVVWRCEQEFKNHFEHNEFLHKMLKLLQNELDGNSEFGIGKNGFYMIMKAISLAKSPTPPTA
ncbi:hypothetical protein LS71_002595 [Helicobacter jaachi]|uniref:Uncharacterized protein n=1 Tax=Helicobacter jaachi TaxID=1677920 RepID=A0A4U8TG16_9HELI|nr:hypothetical protein [Helicobacter jaachi]TLD97647.1 hypothetical protein LS71_002595 [Helicobacter jaachi]